MTIQRTRCTFSPDRLTSPQKHAPAVGLFLATHWEGDERHAPHSGGPAGLAILDIGIARPDEADERRVQYSGFAIHVS